MVTLIPADLAALLDTLPFFPTMNTPAVPFDLGTYLNGLAAAINVATGPEGVFKTADQAISGTTALQTDNELTLTVQDNTRYIFRMSVFMNQAGNSGMKFALAGTATMTSMKVQVEITDTVLRASERMTALNQVVAHGGAGSGDHYAFFDGVLDVNVGGTIVLQWGQNSSSGSALTAQKDSYMTLQPL